MDKSDSPPPTASYDHLPLDVWLTCHQEISGEAGDFDPVVVGSGHAHGLGDADGRVDAHADADCVDADGAGDGGDIKGGNWWDPCTFDYHHGHLGESHFFMWNNIDFVPHLSMNQFRSFLPNNFVWFYITLKKKYASIKI